MNIRTTVVCLPVRDVEKTLAFYRDALDFSEIQIDAGMIALELPNLSLLLMGQESFENYSKKAGRGAQFSDERAGVIISCAMKSRDDVDAILESAPMYGGRVAGKAAMDEASGGYIGYFSDPDGHLWNSYSRMRNPREA